MPRKREIHRQGINTSGNEYTVYNDGSYRYKNVNHDTGKTSSSYFDTNNGHSFFRKNGRDGYNFHENQNQGFRDYSPNAKPVAQGMISHGNEFQFIGDNSYRYNNKNPETGNSSSSYYNYGNGSAQYRKSDQHDGGYRESQGSRDYNPNIVIIVNRK